MRSDRVCIPGSRNQCGMTFFWIICLALFASCTPARQEYREASVAPALEKNIYITADGERLPLRTWVPAGRPRAAVVALHGFNDYSHGFAGTGDYLRKYGVATYSYDQRGFGATESRGIWAGEDNLVRDAAGLVRLVKRRHPNIPVYLMGESMGGAVALLTSAKHELPVEGVILLAPALWGAEHMPLLYRPSLWLAAHTLPGYKMTGEGLRILASNNIEMLRALGRDPLVIKATRLDAIYGLTGMMDDAYDHAARAKPRILLLYGFKDQLVPRPPIEAAKARFTAPAQTIYYDEGYHMLTRDLQGKDVLRDIRDWILAKPRD